MHQRRRRSEVLIFCLEFATVVTNDCRNLFYECVVVCATWNASLEHNANVDSPKVVTLASKLLCSPFYSLPFAVRRATYCPVNDFSGTLQGYFHSNRLTAQLDNEVRSLARLRFTIRGQRQRVEDSVESGPFGVLLNFAGHYPNPLPPRAS